MTTNVLNEGIKFYNARTGKTHRTFPEAAKAYYNQQTGLTKSNYKEAESEYYSAVNRGALQAPVTPGGTTAVVVNTQQLTGVAPTGVYATKVTFTVAGGVITAIALS